MTPSNLRQCGYQTITFFAQKRVSCLCWGICIAFVAMDILQKNHTNPLTFICIFFFFFFGKLQWRYLIKTRAPMIRQCFQLYYGAQGSIKRLKGEDVIVFKKYMKSIYSNWPQPNETMVEGSELAGLVTCVFVNIHAIVQRYIIAVHRGTYFSFFLFLLFNPIT